MLRFAGMLVLAFAGAVQAGEEPEASAIEHRAFFDYQLAGAAQSGDAVSDWLLSDMFTKQLHYSETGLGMPVDPALVGRLVEERDRLIARADAELMDDPRMLAMRLPCYGEQRDLVLCAEWRARLAEIDGDNAFTALVLMAAAWGAEDSAGFAAAAALGARTTHYESGFTAGFRSMRARFAAVPDSAVPDMPLVTDGIDRADANAMGLYAAIALPPFQNFGQPCRESEGELLDHCLAIARRMTREAQSVIEVYIGASLLERRGSAADKEHAASRRRELAWLQHQSMLMWQATEGADVPRMREYFDDFAGQGEEVALRNLLRDRGQALTPPPGWVEPGRTASP